MVWTFEQVSNHYIWNPILELKIEHSQLQMLIVQDQHKLTPEVSIINW